jgi:hypothetical protein
MLRIREATADDNEALLRLEAESPQGTGISILIDRDDYFYRSRLHDRSKVMIAEEEGKLVGVMAFAIKDIFLEGDVGRAAYFYDLRGEASYRRSMKRGLFRLWKAVAAEIEEGGGEFIYGHVKADNYASLSVSTKMGAQVAASFDILSLPSVRGRVFELDRHLVNLEKEVAQIEEAVGERCMRPPSLLDAYTRGAELGYLKGIFRLKAGGSSAQVSAWDISSIYRGRVLHMPLGLRLLGGVLNPLARLVPAPRVPVAGEHIKYMQLFDPICRGPRGHALLKQLLQQIRRNAYQSGIDILTLFVYRDDPLASVPRFFPEKLLHYHTLVRPLSSSRLPEPPLYLDIRDI